MSIKKHEPPKELYPEMESKNLEFKSIVKKFDSIIKTCIAFANGVGGRIIIGIDDNDRKIIGIDDQLRDKIYNDFPNSLYDSTTPHLIPQIYEQRLNDFIVLIIEIPPCLKKPCFLTREGLPKGVYLRIGSSTRRANKEYIEDLMRESQRMTFDEEPIQTSVDTLSKTLLSDYYTASNNKRFLEDKIITRSPANTDQFYPTVAGILLFSSNPEKFIHEAHIVCTRFAGTEGRDIIQTEEIKGPMNRQIDISYHLVLSWLKRDYQLIRTQMKSKTLIPSEALREAITNAIIHRKYWVPGATKIAVYDDRLEIFSPGNFPGHVDIQNLGEGITHLRNPILGRMAHKMGIIEKLGSGIKLIFESCKKSGLETPKYSENGDYVKVTFSFSPANKLSKPDRERLLDLFKIKDALTVHDMTKHLERSKNTVFKILRELIKSNKIKKIGRGRATRYTINKKS